MTTTEAISEYMRSVDRFFRGGNGGVYSAIAEIVHWSLSLDSHDKDLLCNELLRLIAVQDEMWGVAVEVLLYIQQSAPRNAAIPSRLASLLNDENHTEEWEADILLALMRLSYQPIAERALDHITRRLAAGDRSALSMLAALSRVDAEKCLEIATRVFIDTCRKGQLDKRYNSISAFVDDCLDVDRSLLIRFIRNIHAADKAAGQEIAEIVREYIGRSFMREKLGDELHESLERDVLSACSEE
ncbi:MAG TPA: hypothetical protein DD670_19715 [Planctomycetaceae bacterium]|nr:hypothetical protein [Planctomycetaceae bacterium]